MPDRIIPDNTMVWISNAYSVSKMNVKRTFLDKNVGNVNSYSRFEIQAVPESLFLIKICSVRILYQSDFYNEKTDNPTNLDNYDIDQISFSWDLETYSHLP